MTALEIYVNGEKTCVAGIGEDGVVTAILSSMTRPQRSWSELEVRGLTYRTNETLKWIDRELVIGDEIRVKLVSASAADPPLTKRNFSERTG